MYRRRIIDETLDELLSGLAAISLDGAKGVGKTATGVERARTIVDLSVTRKRSLIEADDELAIQGEPPVFIDEWQLVPSVWDCVKRAVDADRTGGRFLLAGSAGVAPGSRIHSGAGRIVSLKMRPLSLAERGLDHPAVSLASLMQGDCRIPCAQTDVSLSDYTDEIINSGFPGIRDLPARARTAHLESYVTRIVTKELQENGANVRRSRALHAWLHAYGAATSGTASYTTLLDAATSGEDEKIRRSTADIYREHLSRLFILDPLPAWIPVFNPLKRLTNAPKHHLVDPALAARLVGVGKQGLLDGKGERVGTSTGTWLGALFESLAVQSVRVYADAMHATVGHLRTKQDNGNAREIDIIIEGEDRRILAMEVKLSATVSSKDVQHLNWLDKQLGERLADKIVINTGSGTYRRKDGVAVIPLALLGP